MIQESEKNLTGPWKKSFRGGVQPIHTPAWGHQRVGGFTMLEGLSPEIAILMVSGESLRTHYEEGPETLDIPA